MKGKIHRPLGIFQAFALIQATFHCICLLHPKKEQAQQYGLKQGYLALRRQPIWGLASSH